MAILNPGSTWAGFLIVKLLGSGGFAEVYEVRDRTGVRRALKLLDAPADLASKLQVRLAQEGEALAMIEHPNVLRFYDAGIEENRVWLLLELVEGISLREIEDACGGRPPLESVLRWGRQACEGLAAAHALGVIHRDVKPENLLVTPSDVVKVIDFGLAKLTGWGVKTTHQRLMGTAFYMAPEHLRSKPPGHRMDVYAMGLVLYEAIAGAHPIMQLGGPLTMLVVCGRQLSYTPPPLATLAREVPGDLSDLVQRAIEKDPARRIATMSELAAGLQSVLSRLLVDRRNVVRDLPLPGREVGLQRTIPMAAHEDPPVPRGAGGTIKLQAFDAPPVSVPPATLPPGPRSEAVTRPEIGVHLTGDRPAMLPPVKDDRRRRRRIVVAIVLALVLGVGAVWFGIAVLLDGHGVPPARRHR
jgi:serine/threonine protein kinase